MQSEKKSLDNYQAPSILPREFDDFRSYLEQHSGIVLSDNKGYLVASRLSQLMIQYKIESFADLIARIKSDASLSKRTLDAMTTNETSWFRDNYPYDLLQKELLPILVKSKLPRIRIWSAACSTGQEPYSMRIIIEEYLSKNPGLYSKENIEIMGTDISSRALGIAKQGSYDSAMAARGLLPERKQRFFIQQNESWQVRDELKNAISFRELNLKQSFTSLGKFDIIFCRNVLIYFSAELKKDVLQRMAKALNPGGYLIVGGSESVNGYCEDFDLVSWNGGVIYRLKKDFTSVF
ncbi:MAG: protein-glutamate O-methyltransferase CheR [Thiohalomonadales bacterium]